MDMLAKLCNFGYKNEQSLSTTIDIEKVAFVAWACLDDSEFREREFEGGTPQEKCC